MPSISSCAHQVLTHKPWRGRHTPTPTLRIIALVRKPAVISPEGYSVIGSGHCYDRYDLRLRGIDVFTAEMFGLLHTPGSAFPMRASHIFLKLPLMSESS
jgi:hypothetical protein